MNRDPILIRVDATPRTGFERFARLHDPGRGIAKATASHILLSLSWSRPRSPSPSSAAATTGSTPAIRPARLMTWRT